MNSKRVSCSSSDDELSDETGRIEASMVNVADLLWHKIKSDSQTWKNGDRRTAATKTTKSSTSDKSVDHTGTSPSTSEQQKFSFSNLALRAKEKPSAATATASSSATTASSSSSKGSASTTAAPTSVSSRGKAVKGGKKASVFKLGLEDIRALNKNAAEEAMKQMSQKVTAIESVRQKKKQAKLEKSQWRWAKGSWGAMRMAEETEENKRDLMVLNMRSTIYSKQHLKASDLKNPKFYQLGTVVESATDFYRDRIPKKQRKLTLVDELMADKEFKKDLKHRYNEVMETKTSRKGLYQGKAPRRIKKRKK